MAENNLFQSPSKGGLSVNEVIEEVTQFVREMPQSYYRLVIGTDSQAKMATDKTPEIDFITAVIIHRQGHGARYFWKKEKKERIPSLREKIYTETIMSLACAEEMVPLFRKAITPAKYDFEIHIDVGPIGPTREMIKEVVGMVNGNGYIAKTKPESWGASSVADKHT